MWGTAVEVIQVLEAFRGAAATLVAGARLVRKAWRRIASRKVRRPTISLGAAEHLAMADLVDRAGAAPRVLGSVDACSHSPDRGFARGHAFFVVLTTGSELHLHQVSAHGEVHYFGASSQIPDFMDASPPHWAGGEEYKD